MTILISDLDGTLTNNKHRIRYLENNIDLYFSNIERDRKNKIGVDLYKNINAEKHIIISDRPSYWPPNTEIEHFLVPNKNIIKIWYITQIWLNYYNIVFDELLFVNSNISNRTEEKVKQLNKIIKSIQNKKIIYLEDDIIIAKKIKKIYSFVDVNLISYNNAQRL